MKLYMFPVSATCRPLQLFIADNGIDVELQAVDLMTGEHKQEPYASVNPNGLVPVFEDGDFRLTESSAILKYLADKIDSPAYPKDLQERARVNETMDWINTQFYRDYGYGLVYPQLFPHHKRPTDEIHEGVVAWGKDRSAEWMQLLNDYWLGDDKPYLCGDQVTIADYFGISIVSIGELIRCDFSAYPNVERWIARMKELPSWPDVYGPAEGFIEAVKEKPFVAL